MMSRHPRQNAGFTLIEVSIVVVLMAVAMVALLGTLAKLPLVDQAQDEEIMALQAAQTKIEELENTADTDFGNLWTRYNSDQLDDPADGVSPGANFAVDGLAPSEVDADGMCGEVEFPETDGVLDETIDWGDGPQHIDGDSSDYTEVSAEDYKVLPVRVNIQFRSATGHVIIKTLETTLYGVR